MRHVRLHSMIRSKKPDSSDVVQYLNYLVNEHCTTTSTSNDPLQPLQTKLPFSSRFKPKTPPLQKEWHVLYRPGDVSISEPAYLFCQKICISDRHGQRLRIY